MLPEHLRAQLTSKEPTKSAPSGGLAAAAIRGWEASVPGLLADKEPTPGQPRGIAERTVQGASQVLFDLPAYIGFATPGTALGTAVGGPAGAIVGAAVGGASSFGLTSATREALRIRKENPTLSLVEIAGKTAEKWPEVGKEAILGALTGSIGLASKVGLNTLVSGTAATAEKAAVEPVIKGLSKGTQTAIKTGGQVASEAATFGTAGPALEGRTPTIQDYVDATALISLLTGGRYAVRQVRAAFKARPPDVTKVLDDLRKVEELRAKGEQEAADALQGSVVDTINKALGKTAGMPDAEGARRTEGIQEGVERATAQLEKD